HNYGKYILYNDPFIGLVDNSVHEGDAEKYAAFAANLQAEADKGTPFTRLYAMQAALCRALAIKCDLGVRTRAAYQAGDQQACLRLAEEDFAVLPGLLRTYHTAFRTVWDYDNKPFGWEVQDARLGGLILRVEECGRRLLAWSKGELDSIPELEETPLPYWYGKDGARIEEQAHSRVAFLVKPW
ncbi:MAG: hypothetical protein IJC29_02460, partial [Clostridia bacterium]|nr:hypothetical protein [Clostridia bacterium]